MLSNKLTFSLVFVLMLALVAGPALAQTQTPTANLNSATLDTDGDATDGPMGANDFIVVVPAANANIVLPADSTAAVSTRNADTVEISALPNLKDLFEFGGTVELLLGSLDSTTDANKTAPANYRLAITEIMWGLEMGAATDPDNFQWIEVYNAGEALKTADEVRLVFTTNQRVDRLGDKLTDDNVTGLTADATYTVVDRVSVVNRFGARWAPKGQSGRITNIDADNPAANLVSMYRKRSTNADKTMYKYKADGAPDGDKFADGTDGGQWIQSIGRINMTSAFIGTPGSVQQDDGGQVVSAKTPASLPATSVIINEIFNSEGLQWVELHNTGTAEVNVKNWELEAALGGTSKKELRRVFAIPDKDTKIPAGGFLVITNRQPADTILAGGVDLHDSNKFAAGARQLYIVITEGSVTASGKKQPKPQDNDKNEWMPGKGFLLILRNGNDKNNHEKIVDIAGNAFDKVVDPDLVTDVWPLRGWTVPGDRDNGDFGDAANSLNHNVGKTYARIEQKSGGNRLHKDHWRMDGIVGGLGYDPGVDLAIAPGTPGYANNAQKANPADITGEVVISEIMYDAGANGNLVQWIELYNSSMTQSALLNGDWELEIRNIDTDVESYVDAKFDFENAVILPNQTLLLVSDRSSASDVKSNRVYNLYQRHRNELGLSARKSILLSSVGFHLELRYKTTVVDEAGNVMLDGPRRSVEWALPETGGDMRYSILRGFGTKAFDGTADMANDGTMASSWIMAQSVGSYYGHRDDVGSPGHREGSPLPVSLSSFRPVRDKATGEVVIRWVTQSELNNAGFNILRSETKTGEFKVVNVKGIIAGHGTTSEKHTYEWKDTTAKPNVVYYYQIEDVSLDGERTTLRTTHLRGNVNAAGKVTTTWGDLKTQ